MARGSCCLKATEELFLTIITWPCNHIMYNVCFSLQSGTSRLLVFTGADLTGFPWKNVIMWPLYSLYILTLWDAQFGNPGVLTVQLHHTFSWWSAHFYITMHHVTKYHSSRYSMSIVLKTRHACFLLQCSEIHIHIPSSVFRVSRFKFHVRSLASWVLQFQVSPLKFKSEFSRPTLTFFFPLNLVYLNV